MTVTLMTALRRAPPSPALPPRGAGTLRQVDTLSPRQEALWSQPWGSLQGESVGLVAEAPQHSRGQTEPWEWLLRCRRKDGGTVRASAP